MAVIFVTGCASQERSSGPQPTQAAQAMPTALCISTQPAETQLAAPVAAAETPKTGTTEPQIEPLPIKPGEVQCLHKVWLNESLWSIAREYYGDGNLWTVIYEANKDQIISPKKIYPKQMLVIPQNGD